MHFLKAMFAWLFHFQFTFLLYLLQKIHTFAKQPTEADGVEIKVDLIVVLPSDLISIFLFSLMLEV